MDLLIIAPHFPVTETKSIATWALKQCQAMNTVGAEVRVVSPSPYIPAPVGNALDVEKWASLPYHKQIGGIDVYYPKVPVYKTDLTNKILGRLPRIRMAIMWATCNRQVTTLFREFEPDATLAHHPIPGGYLAEKLSRIFETPYAVMEHSLTDLDYSTRIHGEEVLYRRVLSEASAVFTVSNMMKNEIERRYDSIDTVYVVYNGYDPDELVTDNPAVSYSENFKILSVGSLIERKGHMTLIKAIERLPPDVREELSFTIVGDGPKEESLKNYVNENIADVPFEFLCNVSRQRLNKLMSLADLFVLLSWNEPYAVVYPEVMAHGTPAVITKNEGFSELIEDRQNGFLVPMRNADKLAKTLEWAISHPAKLEQIGEAGRELAQSRLQWKHNAEKLLNHLRTVTDD